MSGQLLLAQTLWNSGQASSTTSTALIVVGLVIAFIIAIAIFRAKGSGEVSRGGRGAGPSTASRASYSKGAFKKAARSSGLADADVRFLEEYGRALGLSNPEFAFRNPQKLDAFFKGAYRQIEKSSDSETEAEELKARLFAARERLERARSLGGAIRSTRQLEPGKALTFISPGKESFPTTILAVEPSGLFVEPVADSYGTAIRFKRGTRLSCCFYAGEHQGFQFFTRVGGLRRIEGKEAMLLGHSDEVKALPSRKHERRETHAPCTIYRIEVRASAAKNGKKTITKVEKIPYPGTIVDISAGGLGLKCANPLSPGEYVKIVFNPGGRDQAAYAKVIRTEGSRGIGGTMHVQFVKISRQGLNAILSYVYGYSD